MGVEVPDGDAGGNGDIERVLGAALRNLEADVAGINDALIDAVDFVPGDEGIAGARLRGELLKRYRVVDLLETAYRVTGGVQVGNGGESVGIISPSDRLLGAEGGLVDFGRRGRLRDATEHQSLDGEGIAGAEYRAYIVEGAHVVEDHGERYAPGSGKFLGREAPHIPYGFFLHSLRIMVSPSRSGRITLLTSGSSATRRLNISNTYNDI